MMKLVLAKTLLVILALTLSGCTAPDAEVTPEPEPTQTPETQEPPQTPNTTTPPQTPTTPPAPKPAVTHNTSQIAIHADEQRYIENTPINITIEIDTKDKLGEWELYINQQIQITGTKTNTTYTTTQEPGTYNITLKAYFQNHTNQANQTIKVIPELPDWGNLDGKQLYPGINVAGCTTNYLFTQDNTKFYLGAAAHCFTTESAGNSNGCRDIIPELGEEYSFHDTGNVVATGTLAYTSWGTMNELGYTADTHRNECWANDFALIEINPADLHKVHPNHPTFGGTPGLYDGPKLNLGTQIYGYGSSTLRFDQAHEKAGTVLGYTYDDWTIHVYLATPGIFGDSGSAIFTEDGYALGIASTIAIAPITGSNNYALIAPALEFANQHTDNHFELVTGTNFTPLL